MDGGTNKIIARMLNQIADMLSIDDSGGIRFEVRAYRRAALSIEALDEDLADIYKENGVAGLMEIDGVGAGISKSIEEYINTGKMRKYEKLKRKYPVDFDTLTRIEGLGPKRVALLYEKLGVTDLKTLKRAIDSHRIHKLPGFGEKTERIIADSVSHLESDVGRLLLGDAMPEAERIREFLLKSGHAVRVEIAGSIRRMRGTVGDIDILATSKRSAIVMKTFAGMDGVEEVVLSGPKKTTVKLKIGINCDLRVVEEKSFGTALQYFTGNKFHNVKVRTIAIRKGLKLNEYGLFDNKGRNLASGKEEGWIYEKLGMAPMPPEMREDRGEIDLALSGKLPELVGIHDIKGDLHTHTNDSDGMNGIDEMVSAARSAGLSYIATTNHTKSLRVANGMDERRFSDYFRMVDKLNEKLEGFRILKGAEIDILKGGELDMDREMLCSLDCAVGSVHSYLSMEGNEMTKRIIKAIESGMINILGHPTGRILLGREGYAVDIEKIADAAKSNNVALEINASPERLDISDSNIMEVYETGVRFAINSDAHSTGHFKNLRYGVGTARRGWVEKGRVLNTMELNKLIKILQR